MNTKQKQNQISVLAPTGIHKILSKAVIKLINKFEQEKRKNGVSPESDEIIKHWQILMKLKDSLTAQPYVPIQIDKVLKAMTYSTK